MLLAAGSRTGAALDSAMTEAFKLRQALEFGEMYVRWKLKNLSEMTGLQNLRGVECHCERHVQVGG
jgi:hypothetical protein